jgi:hypothetical protein
VSKLYVLKFNRKEEKGHHPDYAKGSAPFIFLSNSEKSLIKLSNCLVVGDSQNETPSGPTATDGIHLHKKEKTGDEDLLESAAIQTLLNGGTVYMVEPEKMLDDESLAAVFRY